MTKKLPKFITTEEFKKILSKEKDKKFKLAYALGFGSGLRISEIVGLEDKSATKAAGLGRIYGYSQRVWIVKPLIEEQVNLQTHQIRLIGKGDKERITVTSPMLNETNIKLLPLLIERRTLQRRFTALCEKVLSKHLTFHNLRHSFANFMVNEKNIPLPMMQAMLGHARLDTTGIYTRANPKQAIDTAWEAF